MRIVGILLAAGQGSRFGGGKLLARMKDGTPMGVQSARRLHAALDEVIAVVRPEDDALAELLSAEAIRVERCPNAHEGMGASLAHAVRASMDADGWVVALADMPMIDPRTIVGVAAALRAGERIAAPSYRGARGHPVGFTGALGPRLVALDGDTGARDILRAESEHVRLVDVEDAGVLADIDTPGQLDELDAQSRQ